MRPCPLSFSSTSAALPTPILAVGILGRIFMSARAVSNRRSGYIASRNRSLIPASPAQVLLKGDGLKMVGIHAAANAAQVVKLQSIWHRAMNGFPQKTMSLAALSWAFQVAQLAVSTSIKKSHPNPAPGFGDHFNVLKNSLRYAFSSHVTPFSRIGQGCFGTANSTAARFYFTPEMAA